MKKVAQIALMLAFVLGWAALFLLGIVSIDSNEHGKYCMITSIVDADWNSQNIPCKLNKIAIIKDFGLGLIIFPLIFFLILFPLALLFKSISISFLNLKKDEEL
jgi:hypothetical protein